MIDQLSILRFKGVKGMFKSEKWEILFVLLCIACIALTTLIPYGNDDMFITLRYARNLAAGRGFVFNSGEKYLGVTTPLYVIIIAFFSIFSKDFVLIAMLLSYMSLIFACFYLYLIFKRFKLEIGGLIASILIVSNGIISAAHGMELNFFMLLIFAAIFYFLKNRFLIVGLLCGASILIRPEGICFFLWPAIYLVLTGNWKNVSRYLLGLMSVLVPWIMFSTFYFGFPLPQTIRAKAVIGELRLQPSFWDELIKRRAPSVQVYWFLALLGVFYSVVHKRIWELILLAFLISYLAAYRILSPPPFIWYYVPLVFVFYVFVGECIGNIAKDILGRLKLQGIVAKYCVFVLTMSLALIYTVQSFEISGLRQIGKVNDIRKEIGLWINNHAKANSSIQLSEAGIIPFYAPNSYVIDTLGLVTPQVSKRISTGSENQFFKEMSPGYIIVKSQHQVLSQEFRRNYSLVKSFPGYFIYSKVNMSELLAQISKMRFIQNSVLYFDLPSHFNYGQKKEFFEGASKCIDAQRHSIELKDISEFSTDMDHDAEFVTLKVVDGKIIDTTQEMKRITNLITKYKNEAEKLSVSFEREEDIKVWKPLQYITVDRITGGKLYATSYHYDPILVGPEVNIPLDLIENIEVRMSVITESKRPMCQVIFNTSLEDEKRKRFVNIQIHRADEDTFFVYKINFLDSYEILPGENLTRLRFDPLNCKGNFVVDYIKLNLKLES